MNECNAVKLSAKQITCLRHLNANGGCYADTPNCSRSVLGALYTVGFVTGGSGRRWHITISGANWLERHDAAGKS